MSKTKPRKPRGIKVRELETEIRDGEWVILDDEVLDPTDCRRLAAWLIRAAVWLEHKEKGVGR